REAGVRGAAVGGLEDELHLLADLDAVHVAVDDVRHHRRALVERDIGNAILLRRAPHDAVGVDRALARDLDQLGIVAEGEGRQGARVPVELARVLALAHGELARGAIVPELLRLGVRLGCGDLPLGHADHSLSRMTVALPWRVPSEPPVPCARTRSQLGTCTFGCASPRAWRTASSTLVRPPRLDGWLLQSPPPSVLKGSLPTPEIRLPSETNLPPWPFSQKPKSSSCISTVMVKLS